MSDRQIIRGSSWIGFANYLRGTNRNSFSPDGWFDGLSFRVVQDRRSIVVRGGSFGSELEFCEPCERESWCFHDDSHNSQGFRVVEL